MSLVILSAIANQASEKNQSHSKENIDIRLKKSKEMVRFLSEIISKNPKQDKIMSLRPCSFGLAEMGLEDGICTYYGACRMAGKDYMYQGGCGKMSRWGNSSIMSSMACSMAVTRRRMVKGKCTKSGHCWAGYHIKLLHTGCQR